MRKFYLLITISVFLLILTGCGNTANTVKFSTIWLNHNESNSVTKFVMPYLVYRGYTYRPAIGSRQFKNAHNFRYLGTYDGSKYYAKKDDGSENPLRLYGYMHPVDPDQKLSIYIRDREISNMDQEIIKSVGTNADFKLVLEMPKIKYSAHKRYLLKTSMYVLKNKTQELWSSDLLNIRIVDENGTQVYPPVPGPVGGYVYSITATKDIPYRNLAPFVVNKPGNYKVSCFLQGYDRELRPDGSESFKPRKDLVLETKPIEVTVE